MPDSTGAKVAEFGLQDFKLLLASGFMISERYLSFSKIPTSYSLLTV